MINVTHIIGEEFPPMDFDQGVDYMDIYRLFYVSAQGGKMDARTASAKANVAASVHMFRNSGSQLFTLEPELAHAVKNTDVNVPPSLLTPPYKSFAVQTDPKEVTYVTFTEDHVRIVAVRYSKNPQDVTAKYIKIPMNIERDLNTVITASMVDCEMTLEDSVYLTEKVSTVFNTVLYLQTHNDTKAERSNRKLDLSKKKSIKNAVKPSKYTRVGMRYQMPATPDKRQLEFRKIGRVFWVRGFWRNQPCGAGRKDRKLIFVKPFIKGSGVAGAREYRVV